MNITRTLYSKQGHKPEMTSPKDFMIDWMEGRIIKEEKPKQSVEQMKEILMSLANMSKGKK